MLRIREEGAGLGNEALEWYVIRVVGFGSQDSLIHRGLMIPPRGTFLDGLNDEPCLRHQPSDISRESRRVGTSPCLPRRQGDVTTRANETHDLVEEGLVTSDHLSHVEGHHRG